MAGVAVDRYGFVYDCFHHLPLVSGNLVSGNLVVVGCSTDPPRQGRCRVTLCSPAAHPPSNRSSSGGCDPSRAAMADAPVVMTPLSQCTRWFGPGAQPQGNARWELAYPQVYHVISCDCLSGLIHMPGVTTVT